MDIVPILSTVILSTTFATLLLAVISYVAFKLRSRRRPAPRAAEASAPGKTFFVRYHPAADAPAPKED